MAYGAIYGECPQNLAVVGLAVAEIAFEAPTAEGAAGIATGIAAAVRDQPDVNEAFRASLAPEAGPMRGAPPIAAMASSSSPHLPQVSQSRGIRLSNARAAAPPRCSWCRLDIVPG